MKNLAIILSIVLIVTGNLNASSEKPDGRQRLLIDLNWKFILSDMKGAEEPKFNDWRTLNLLHDWSIEGEFREDPITKVRPFKGLQVTND